MKLSVGKGLNFDPTNASILYHDNAPAHKALSVKHFLLQKSITDLERPPYFPDLAPNNL
jgi:transposase